MALLLHDSALGVQDPKNFTTVPPNQVFTNLIQKSKFARAYRTQEFVLMWYLPIFAHIAGVKPDEVGVRISETSVSSGHSTEFCANVTYYIVAGPKAGHGAQLNFNIGPQNNCCGACTVTYINKNSRGLGILAMYIIDDLARSYYKKLITATTTTQDSKMCNLAELFGWKSVVEFNNVNSGNNVRLYTKLLENVTREQSFTGERLSIYYEKIEKEAKEEKKKFAFSWQV